VSTLVVDVVTSDDALHRLGPAWQYLWQRAPAATPFQSPIWLLAWWRVFGTQHPVLACLYADSRLAGILPLYLLDDVEGRKLLPIGVSLSDYFDVLLEAGAPDDAADVLLAAALRTGADSGVGWCDLIDVHPDASLRHVQPPAGWLADWRRTEPCPVLTLHDEAVPKRQRRKLRMAGHRADRLGGCRFEWSSGADLARHMDALLRWNGAIWGMDAVTWQFHQAAAAAMHSADLLRLGVLHLGDSVAACCTVMPQGSDRLLFHLTGFDPAYGAASPGSLLLAAVIEAARAEGRSEMHFLRGGEAYKHAWGARDRHNAACRLRCL